MEVNINIILEFLGLIILAIAFIKLRYLSLVTSIILGIMYYYSNSTIILSLFGFSLGLFIVTNSFLIYLNLLSGINNASFKAKIEQKNFIINFYDIFHKILIIIGAFIGLLFVIYGIYRIIKGYIPIYLLYYQIIPLIILSFFGLREGFKFLKKTYYLNYVLENDINYAFNKIKDFPDLYNLINIIGDKDEKELISIKFPDFVLNRLRHRIPEKKIFNIIKKYLNKNNTNINDLIFIMETFVKNLNNIFGLYYHKEIFFHLKNIYGNKKFENEIKENKISKYMYMLYIIHAIGLYNYKNKKNIN